MVVVVGSISRRYQFAPLVVSLDPHYDLSQFLSPHGFFPEWFFKPGAVATYLGCLSFLSVVFFLPRFGCWASYVSHFFFQSFSFPGRDIVSGVIYMIIS